MATNRITALAPPKKGGGFKFPVEDYLLPMRDTYLGNPLVKRGHTQQQFTEEQMIEIYKCSQSPEYFAENYCRIVSVDKGIVPFKMWKFQKAMLRQYHKNRFALTVTARQMGKTTTTAVFILWYAIFHSDKECAILANKGDQAQEVVSRLKQIFEYLPFFLQPGVLSYNKRSVEFDNGSKIMSAATSSASIRGHSVALLYIDEAAFIENDIQFYESTYPVVTGGAESRVIMTSTPKGKRGMFYKLYMDSLEKRNSYKNLTVTWRHRPDRDQAWKEETIRNTSQSQFDQEFECMFRGSSGTLIPSNVLEQLVFMNPVREDEFMKVFEDCIVEKEGQKGHKYVAVADPAGGLGQDYSVCTVFDVTVIPYRVVARYRNNTISPLLFPYTIVSMCTQYNNCPLLIEANNDVGGQVSYIVYYELEYENTVLTSPDSKGMGQKVSGSRQNVPGVKTTSKVKGIGCANLKTLLENSKIEINDFETIEELGTFIEKGKSYEADDDCHDDCVMTLVLFSWFVKQEFFKDYTENDIGRNLYEANKELMMENLIPFGFSNNDEEGFVQTNFGSFKVIEGSPNGMESWFAE